MPKIVAAAKTVECGERHGLISLVSNDDDYRIIMGKKTTTTTRRPNLTSSTQFSSNFKCNDFICNNYNLILPTPWIGRPSNKLNDP